MMFKSGCTDTNLYLTSVTTVLRLRVVPNFSLRLKYIDFHRPQISRAIRGGSTLAPEVSYRLLNHESG